MSTTFGIKIGNKEIPIARRVGGPNGAIMNFTTDWVDTMEDDKPVIPLDNSAQGIYTIGDIREHIKNQKNMNDKMDNHEVNRSVITKLSVTIIEIYEPDYWDSRTDHEYKGHYMVLTGNGQIPHVFFTYSEALLCGIAINAGHTKDNAAAVALGAGKFLGVNK